MAYHAGKGRIFAALLVVSTCAMAEPIETPESLTAAVRAVGARHNDAMEFIRSGVAASLRTYAAFKYDVRNATCRIPPGSDPDPTLVAEIAEFIVKADVQFYGPQPKDYTASLVVIEATNRACEAFLP